MARRFVIYSAKAAGSGVRELPLEKFFVIPKSENELEHDLKPGEMVIEIVVPPPAQNLKAGQLRSPPDGRHSTGRWRRRPSRSRWTATR